MKKFLSAFWLALFLLSIPVFAEARAFGERQPASLNSSALEFNQTTGVGRIRTRRGMRRRVRRMRRRHMRRVLRRRYRIVRHRRRMRM